VIHILRGLRRAIKKPFHRALCDVLLTQYAQLMQSPQLSRHDFSARHRGAQVHPGYVDVLNLPEREKQDAEHALMNGTKKIGQQ
jgi:hypothetical protein